MLNWSDFAPFANHLWQSALFAAGIWLVSLALRSNRAAVRYGLWLTASAKLLVPFSILASFGVSFGGQFAFRAVADTPRWTFAAIDLGQPFARAPQHLASAAAAGTGLLPTLLFAFWIAGCAVNIAAYGRAWFRVRRAVGGSTRLSIDAPIPALSSAARIEPCVVGFLRPVLLLPSGIEQRLTAAEFQAVLTHELCHVRRRDNLTGLLHAIAETVFWFFPLAWWIRRRLVEERERACDEFVLKTSDANVYAESILSVCRFCLRAPAFAAGIAGVDLRKRIAAIVDYRPAQPLDRRRKALLVGACSLALAIPLGMGVFEAPARAQSDFTPSLRFDVASVKPNLSGRAGTDGFDVAHGALTVRNVSLKMLIEEAYGLSTQRVFGARDWMTVDRFDVIAKGPSISSKPQVWWMLQSLLAERFGLTVHRETRDLPVYSLEIVKGGPKMQKLSDGDCSTDPNPGADVHTFSAPCGGVSRAWGPRGGYMVGRKISAAGIADALSEFAGRPVIDKTALSGAFQFQLIWTPEGYQFTPGSNEGRPAVSADPAPSFFEAVQEQLGLKLVSGRTPVEVLVIDNAGRPSGN